MRVLGKKKLVKFMERHANAALPLRSWVQLVEASDWQSPADVKRSFASASFLSNNRIVFNIGGNNFRLLVVVIYTQGSLLVNWIGTHAEYNKLNF